MRKYLLISALLASSLLVLAPAAGAETTAEAAQFLKKMTEVADAGPFSVNMDAEISGMPGAAAGAKGSFKGSLTQGDRKKSHMDMSLNLNAAGAQGGGGQTTMTMMMVNDGETVWTEMLMMGQKQVMKLSLAKAEELARKQGGLSAGATMDPLAQVDAMTKMMDFEIVGREGSVVLLKGTLKPGMKERMPGMDSMVMALDTATGFPRDITLGEKVMVIKFSEFKRLKNVDPQLFVYTPPQGVQVMDLGPILDAQVQAMPPGGAGN
jgi:outer membrane lipoprotein-sorting protein